MCFVDGIKYAAITIVRIGRVCTLDELKAWTDIPKDASNKKVVSWINVMDMITDSGQHAYNDALGDLQPRQSLIPTSFRLHLETNTR